MNEHQPFDENYEAASSDPLDGHPVIHFDYAAVEQALGEAQSETPTDGYQALAALIRKMFLWLTDVDAEGEDPQTLVGRRTIALAWVLDPALFTGSPSATTLAKRMFIPSPVSLHKLTGEVARHFGIRNRAQSHSSGNWKDVGQHAT